MNDKDGEAIVGLGIGCLLVAGSYTLMIVVFLGIVWAILSMIRWMFF